MLVKVLINSKQMVLREYVWNCSNSEERIEGEEYCRTVNVVSFLLYIYVICWDFTFNSMSALSAVAESPLSHWCTSTEAWCQYCKMGVMPSPYGWFFKNNILFNSDCFYMIYIIIEYFMIFFHTKSSKCHVYIFKILFEI